MLKITSPKIPLFILLVPSIMWAIYLHFNFPNYAEAEQIQITGIVNTSPDTRDDLGSYTIYGDPLVDGEHETTGDETPGVAETSTTTPQPATEPKTTSYQIVATEPAPTSRGCRITQKEDSHIQEGYGSVYAIDIHCGKKGVQDDSYFPKEKTQYQILAIGEDKILGNYIIIKHGDLRWVYGNTVTSRNQGDFIDTTKDGDVLGQQSKSGVWTNWHTHIEKWKCPTSDSPISDCKNVSSTGLVNDKSDILLVQRGWKKEYIYDPAIEKTPIKTFTLTDEIQIIACLNENNMTIHDPKGTGSSACYLGKGGKWKNIMLPTRKDWETFHEIFGDDLVYRLAIANFEGGFKDNTGNKYAYGYLQTLRSYKIAPDINSQLSWLKNREDNNTGLKCDIYLTEPYTLYGNMNIPASLLAKYTCMARGHYGFFSPSSNAKHYNHSIMYAKRYKATTEFYRSITVK